MGINLIYAKKLEKIENYKHLFEKTMLIGDINKRNGILNSLLNEYRADDDVKDVVTGKSMRGDVEGVDEIEDLEYEMARQIKLHEMGYSDKDMGVIDVIKFITSIREESTFAPYQREAFKNKYGILSPDELNIRIM